MIASLKAAVLRFVRSPKVRSVARHAVTAAAGVLVASYLSGGLTSAVLAVAAAAALRVVMQGVVSSIGRVRRRQAATVAADLSAALAAVPPAPDQSNGGA